MTQADDIKTLRDASAALADIADRISGGGPKPDFTNARQLAVNRFKASPIWKKLEGTPWENDAPTIAAELMCMYAAECRVVSSLMAGEGEDSVSPERMAQLLKARIDRCAELEAALKPYVIDYDEWMDKHPDSEMLTTYRRVTFGEYRAALRALRKPAQEEGK